MTDTIGRGVIEISADARKLKAGIEDAKKSIRTLGEGQKEISKANQVSIDRYIGKLQQQNATLGKSVRETELFKLALRGASNEQLKAADAALRFREVQEGIAAASARNVQRLESLQRGFIATSVAVTALGAAYAGATLRTIDFLDHLNDLNKSTDISVEELAGLSLLAKQTGTDLDGLAKAINKMSVEMGKAPEDFRELGITAKDSIGAFKQFSDIFNALPDIQQRNALAMKVFGKSWAELAPALSEGGQRIGEIIEKGTRLSGVTTEMAKRADDFKDSLEELKISMASFGADFIPVLQRIVNEFIAAKEGAKGFRDTIANFFALSGSQAENPAESLAEIDRKLITLKKNAAEFAGMGFLKRAFSADDIAIVNEQISRAERARSQLLKLIPPSIPKATIADSEDAEAGKRLRGADAARNAARFLKDPKDQPAAKSGATDNSAEQEAKAQLAFDLDQIRKAGDASIAEFSRAQNIMEAMRSAALVDDKAYYAAKLGFIDLNARAQEKAIQEEIALLQRQTFAGKDAAKEKIDNDRKLADASSRLQKVQADAVASRVITSIQEKAANDAIARSLQEAKEATDAYIDSIRRRNQIEIAGIGRGTKARETAAGEADIESRFIEQRRRLEGELRRGQITKDVFDTYLKTASDAYQQEVALYRERTAAIDAAQANWMNGAREALINYYEETRDIAKATEDIWTNALEGTEDALTSMLDKGKLDFSSLRDVAKSVVSDLNRSFIKQNITGPLAKTLSEGNFLGGLFGGIAQQASAPVESRSIAAALNPATSAADAATFSATIAASGATFSTEVIAAGTAFTPEITLAGASFAELVTAAGVSFSTSVATASAGSAGAEAGGGLLSAGASVLGSFAEGISYIPKTGPYELHKGERVVPASQNAQGWGSPNVNITQTFAPGTDSRTVNQAAAAAGAAVQRAMARNT